MTDLVDRLARTLAQTPCACVREFLYSGKGRILCPRCAALVAYEERNGEVSATRREFEKWQP